MRRMSNIVRLFSQLGKPEREWVIARLASDHAKAR